MLSVERVDLPGSRRDGMEEGAGMRIEESVEINRPPEEVFQRNAPDYNRERGAPRFHDDHECASAA
jgi:hypothetical protein